MPRHCVYITQAPTDPIPSAVGDRQTRRAGDTLVIYCADQVDAETLSVWIPGSTYGATIDLNPWPTRPPGSPPPTGPQEY